MSKIVGGSAFGHRDSLIDPDGAVLLDAVTVVALGTVNAEGSGMALGLNLEGRLNKSTERSDVLYLMDADGAAQIIAELLGLADRIGPTFRDALLARIRALPARGET